MENNKIVPKQSFGALKKPTPSAGLTGLQARLAQAKAASGAGSDAAAQRANRLALLLDCSGSMAGDRIDALRKATENFVQSLALGPQGDSALACRCFPSSEETHAAEYPLMIDASRALLAAWQLTDTGCTPMAEAMDFVLESWPLTRAILMSDGQPDSEAAALESARRFKEAGIPVDCVHVNPSSAAGEECLRQIAELTGGLFIKFTDLASFTKSFKYLTPALRPLMLTGAVGAAELGAKEVQK